MNIDLKKGDIILGGRFKNKKIEVKEFGRDELGQYTVNGRKLLSYRIEKLMPKKNRFKKMAADASLAQLAEKAQKEEDDLRLLKSTYRKEYNTRDASALIGLALGALGGSRFKGSRGLGAMLGGVGGLTAGGILGHNIARRRNPKFANAFDDASTEHIEALYDYVGRMDGDRRNANKGTMMEGRGRRPRFPK